MAVRGINPLEKHVEKVFLALAAAGLTGVVAWQVAGGSGLVKVNTEEVPADQAYAKLEEKSKALHVRMRDPNVTVNEKLQKLPDPRGTFVQHLTGKVAPSSQLAFAGTGIKLEIGADEQGRGGMYLPPNLPASVKPIAHAFMSTVHESEAASITDLAKYLPAKAPFDKAAVSVETTIDPKAVRAALEADPDGPGPMKALLRNWWANTEVVAVELVRQQRQPDGSWGGEVATPALPGRADFTQALANPAMNSASLNEIIAGATASAEDVLRPQWYRRAELNGLYAGDAWLRPRDAGKQSGRGDAAPVTRDQRELQGVNDEITRLERLIENHKKGPANPPPPAGGGGGGRRPGGVGGGDGGLSPGGGGAQRPDPKEEQLKQLERRLEDAKKRKAELEKRLGIGGATAPRNNAAGDPRSAAPEGEPSALLTSTDPITVWHHDIDAARGATYRYQLRVKISNPLYNKPSVLPADKADAAKSPTLTIPCADWSDPVHVDDEVYCFITSAGGGANQPGGTGLGTAQASLFYFTWGYWRSDLVT
ncbi:MAG: hypothetical protein K2Q09_01895, partial [Phycisphaerales bacterium]|nr:hypothetical protein [Phycisphaerales bacterium]